MSNFEPSKNYSKYVIVQEIFTPKHWLRKTGDGEWESVDLSPYNGIVPFVFFKGEEDWCHRRTAEHPEKAALLLKAKP